jgi:hypothetical protein
MQKTKITETNKQRLQKTKITLDKTFSKPSMDINPTGVITVLLSD